MVKAGFYYEEDIDVITYYCGSGQVCQILGDGGDWSYYTYLNIEEYFAHNGKSIEFIGA
jgi:hypothetical protein